MTSWTIGGKDEPIDRKVRRESYLQNLPDYIPEEVIEASRWFLDEGECKHEEEIKRILTDKLMKDFWRKLRLKFIKNPYLPSDSKSIEHNWKGLISSCIRLMVWKGGKLPDMSKTEFHNARLGTKNSGVAGEIRRLKNKLNRTESAYKNIASLNIVDLFTLCEKSQNKDISTKGVSALNSVKRGNNLGSMMILLSPNLLDILSALLEQIEAKQPLSLEDEWVPSKNIPSLGGATAQRLYFRKNFLDALYQRTRKNCPSLAATAENVAFDLSPEDRVTAVDLKDS